MVRLALVAHLRRASWLPWGLLILWVSWAVLQEPALLQRNGILLAQWAGTFGAFLVLIALSLGPPAARLPPGCRLAVIGLLAGLVGVTQACLALLVDVALARPTSAMVIPNLAVPFVLAWTGPVTALAGSTRTATGVVTAMLQVVLGQKLAVSMATGGVSLPVVLASLMCIAAALLVGTPSRRL